MSAVHLLRRFLTEENHEELLAEACHKSKREVELLLARRYPREDVAASLRQLPQLEPLSPGRYRLELTIDEADKQELELACDLLSGVQGTADAALVFRRGVRLVVNEAKKRRFGKQSMRRESAASPDTTSAAIQRAATQREPGARESAAAELTAVESASTELAGSEPGGNEPAGREFAAVESASAELAGSESAARELARNESAVSECAAGECAARELAGSESAASECAASELAGTESAARECAASERAASECAASECAAGECAAGECAARESAVAQLVGRAAAAMGPCAAGGTKSKRDHIPRSVASAVAVRDQFRCSFVAADGRRCEARRFLQIHHEVAWAFGGTDTVDNLRLLCAEHNRYLAEEVFGAEHVRASVQRSRATHHRTAAPPDGGSLSTVTVRHRTASGQGK